MDLPSPRELELETLLRQRDTQVSELGDEVTRLRQYVFAQTPPSSTDPVSLPPALTALLLPHLDSTHKSSASTSSTAALTQRTRLLQEENDELYQLLKQGETGKLKEEVRGLRRLVERLEGALRESHQVVISLSTELEKSYEAIMTTAPRAEKSHSRSPRNSYHVPLPTNNGNNGSSASNSNSKLPPTGPRAHKKPRLSETRDRASPPPAGPSTNSKAHTNSSSTSSRPDARTREEHPSPRQAEPAHRGKANHAPRMEVDEPKPRPRSPAERDKDKDKDLRHRDRERRDERERDRERDRDRDGGRRERRNNGNFGGGGGGGRGGGGRRAERGPPSNSAYQGGDRTLKERLGL